MKKISIFLCVLLSYLNILSANPVKYDVSKDEHLKMFNEADDWIDDMPDGLQDKISDALTHSLRGFYSELNYFRKVSNSDVTKYKDVTIENINGGVDSDIPIRMYCSKYDQKNDNLPLLIYFHGGGLSLGSVNVSDDFCKALAASSKVKVASIEYPLVPENSYNSIINKCVEAVEFIYEKQCKKGDLKFKISFGGDGAGGNIALNTYFRLNEKKHNKIDVKSLVLYYPLLSMTVNKDSESWGKYNRGYGLDGRVMEAFMETIESIGNNDKRASDISLISDNILKSLPPVLIITSGRDIVLDEENIFNKRLKRLGVKVRDIEFSGSIHGFITDNHQPTAFNKAVKLTELFLLE